MAVRLSVLIAVFALAGGPLADPTLAKVKTVGEAHSAIYEYKHRPATDTRLTSVG